MEESPVKRLFKKDWFRVLLLILVLILDCIVVTNFCAGKAGALVVVSFVFLLAAVLLAPKRLSVKVWFDVALFAYFLIVIMCNLH